MSYESELKTKAEVPGRERSRVVELFGQLSFRYAPVCKHASEACDRLDALGSGVQSGNGGVFRWAWFDCVAVKMSMFKALHQRGAPPWIW